MKNNWIITEPKEEYNEYDFITDKILKIRGIKEKEKFLNPSDEDINDPFLLSNMDIAVEKITNAIKNNLRIGIYSDIDCDGITSTVIMYKYLTNYNIEAKIIYHQRKDGHGVIVENVPIDLDLLIIVDSSSNSISECEILSDNMEIVILDHHEISEYNLYATVVNPQYNDYSNKHLSGAGVVYQTCRAIDSEMFNDFADEYIDLCTVGLIGDMMNVTENETRALINKGLYKIHNNCEPNLKEILKYLKKDYKPNTTDIAFYVVPFINSIIRLGKIENIIKILITEDIKEIKKLIKSSGIINEKRKKIQGEIINQIDEIIDLSHKIIIVDTTNLKSLITLNGLIANNIAQKYQKPTLVVSIDDEGKLFSGSGRGYGNNFDFKKLLKNTGLFENVEGHSGAFGVEFKPKNINNILDKIDEELDNLSDDYVIEADLILKLEDITWELLYEIQRLSFITGEGFKEPLFIIEGLSVEETKIMKDIHIKFISDELECVKFNVSQEEISNISDALFVDVLGSLSINSWYNFGTKETIRSKQVLVKDIEVY